MGNSRSGLSELALCFRRITACALITFAIGGSLRPGGADAVEIGRADQSQVPQFTLDFSDYHGGPVEQWLRTKGFTFEKDAKTRKLLELSITDSALVLSANRPLSGFILNDRVNIHKVGKVRIKWGCNPVSRGGCLQPASQQRSLNGLFLLRQGEDLERTCVDSR